MRLFRHRLAPLLLCWLCLGLPAGHACGQEAKTVLGPANPDLAEGADALLAGDAERGVRLTLSGLERANGQREVVTGLSNLCAGYIMLGQLDAAIDHCSRALEENDRHWRSYSNRALAYLQLGRLEEAEADLERAEAIAPDARPVRHVRAMLLDKTDPVTPTVIIDDRRAPDDDAG